VECETNRYQDTHERVAQEVGTVAYDRKGSDPEYKIARSNYPEGGFVRTLTAQRIKRPGKHQPTKGEHGNYAEVEHEHDGGYESSAHATLKQVFPEVGHVYDAMKDRGAQDRACCGKKNDSADCVAHIPSLGRLDLPAQPGTTSTT
jgi:hypothetical protein